MEHGIDCPCKGCEAVRKLLREGVESGKIYLSGTDEDKRKIMEKE